MPTLREVIIKELDDVPQDILAEGKALVPMVLDGFHTEHGIGGQVLDERRIDLTIIQKGETLSASCDCYGRGDDMCAHQVALMSKFVETPAFFREAVDSPWCEMSKWRRVSWATWRAAERARHLQALEELRVSDMRSLARGYGWRIRGSRKADVKASFSDAHDVPEHGRQVWEALSPEERFAAALVFWGNADVDLGTQSDGLHALAERYGARALDEDGIDNVILDLFLKGLLTSPTRSKRAWPGHVLAASVARWLPPVLEGIVPAHAALDKAEQLDVRLADPVTCTRSIGLMLNLVMQQGLPVDISAFDAGGPAAGFDASRRNGRPDTPYRIRIPATWVAAETIRALAPVAEITQAALSIEALHYGHIIKWGRGPAMADPAHALALAGEEERVQHATLVRVFFEWTSIPLFSDLLTNDASLSLWLNTGWEDGIQRLVQDVRAINGFLTRVLCSLPNAEWVLMSDLEPLVRVIWPRFSATMVRRPWYRLGEDWDVRATRRKRPDRWARIQGAYLRLMIAKALHWFGLADVAMDTNGHLVAFRLQGLADLYLNRIETVEPPHPPAVANAGAFAANAPAAQAVRIDLPLISVAPMRVSGQALHALGSIAKLDRASLDTLSYTVDPAVCYESFEGGTTLDAILAQWEDTMPLSMPAALRQQLAGYWEHYGEVQLYENLSVIEFADAYALAEMRAVTNLDQHLIAEISPRMVIVKATVVPALVKQLEAAGYVPKLEQAKR